MANSTRFQIAVVSVDDTGLEQTLVGAADFFTPELFRTGMMGCEMELAHGRPLVDEIHRKIVIEFTLESGYDLEDNMESLHKALRTQCFNFDYQEPKVTVCIIEDPKGFGDKAKVIATFSNGTVKTVVEYFNDELTFRADEFLGLSEQQCGELFCRKDKAYLQS